MTLGKINGKQRTRKMEKEDIYFCRESFVSDFNTFPKMNCSFIFVRFRFRFGFKSGFIISNNKEKEENFWDLMWNPDFSFFVVLR
jgi:hypothetical protein